MRITQMLVGCLMIAIFGAMAVSMHREGDRAEKALAERDARDCARLNNRMPFCKP